MLLQHDVVSGNLSKETEFLTEQLDYNKRTLQQVEDENLLLRDKLSMYECSIANNQMASVPRSELSWLRSQEEMYASVEEKARRLEQSEAYLKTTIAELRIGKVCREMCWGVCRCVWKCVFWKDVLELCVKRCVVQVVRKCVCVCKLVWKSVSESVLDLEGTKMCVRRSGEICFRYEGLK